MSLGKLCILTTLAATLGAAITAYADTKSDLGDDSFYVQAPVSVVWDGKVKPNEIERKSVLCFKFQGKTECSMNVLGHSCDSGQGKFYHDKYDTSSGNMKLRMLDLARGVLSFEYTMSGDTFSCDSRFTTKTKSIKITKEKSFKKTIYELATFSCQGIFSQLGTVEIANKLRPERNLSSFCKDIRF